MTQARRPIVLVYSERRRLPPRRSREERFARRPRDLALFADHDSMRDRVTAATVDTLADLQANLAAFLRFPNLARVEVREGPCSTSPPLLRKGDTFVEPYEWVCPDGQGIWIVNGVPQVMWKTRFVAGAGAPSRMVGSG